MREDAPDGTIIGYLAAADDAGDSHVFALVDDADGRFIVDNNQLKVGNAAGIDYETNASHTITVRATDSGDLSCERAFTITVVDVEEPPTDVALDSAVVAENEAAGTVVGTLTTTDEDGGDTHTYTLVSGTGDGDNASFAIDGEALVTAETLDYEAKASYSVRVRATDGGGLSVERAPDLVASIAFDEDGIVLVVRNDGNAPVTDGFWVDLYVEPRTAPSAPNQPWHALADSGMVWGVAGDALPLEAGATLTLRPGDARYASAYSRMPERLSAGTRLYAQVDSFAAGSAHGAVLEGHEKDGHAYNNIAGPQLAPVEMTMRRGVASVGPAISAHPAIAARPEVKR